MKIDAVTEDLHPLLIANSSITKISGAVLYFEHNVRKKGVLDVYTSNQAEQKELNAILNSVHINAQISRKPASYNPTNPSEPEILSTLARKLHETLRMERDGHVHIEFSDKRELEEVAINYQLQNLYIILSWFSNNFGGNETISKQICDGLDSKADILSDTSFTECKSSYLPELEDINPQWLKSLQFMRMFVELSDSDKNALRDSLSTNRRERLIEDFPDNPALNEFLRNNTLAKDIDWSVQKEYLNHEREQKFSTYLQQFPQDEREEKLNQINPLLLPPLISLKDALSSPNADKLGDLDTDVPENFVCGITGLIMTNPASLDGDPTNARFEKTAISKWVRDKGTHPLDPSSTYSLDQLKEDFKLKQEINVWIDEKISASQSTRMSKK